MVPFAICASNLSPVTGDFGKLSLIPQSLTRPGRRGEIRHDRTGTRQPAGPAARSDPGCHQDLFHECERGLPELAVEDNGIGLSSELLSGRAITLGLRIVGILTSQLDAALQHQPWAGTRIVLRFPMRTHVLCTRSRSA